MIKSADPVLSTSVHVSIRT